MSATIKLTDQNGHTQPFSPEHAKALLAYPGTQWSEAKAPKAEAEEAKPATPKN